MENVSNPAEARDYSTVAAFEHRFWLQILGDHARFIYNSLSPGETREVESAEGFQNAFDRVLTRARTADLAATDWIQLSTLALAEGDRFRSFKLHLLRRHLRGDITMNLQPTLLNHMVNELDEYLRILLSLTKGHVPEPVHPLHHDLLWLSDADAHAAFLDSAFDMVESDLHAQSRQYRQAFQQFYLKAVELAGYLRSRVSSFPALTRFHRQVELEMVLFSKFLSEVETLQLSAESLDILGPLMPDHMAREECYYLIKLSQSGVAKLTDCHPTKPRIEHP